MLRIVIVCIIIIFILVVGWQLFVLFRKGNDLNSELTDVNGKISFFDKENENIQADVSFLSKAENLEKEIRSKFNYKAIGEKMMILLP